jgi:hypothetical protein
MTEKKRINILDSKQHFHHRLHNEGARYQLLQSSREKKENKETINFEEGKKKKKEE